MVSGMLLELVEGGARRQRTPALPRPPSCFLRAVSHNRKRVHEASAGLFRSQEFPLWKLRGALGAGGGRPQDRPSHRSHSGSVWASPARGVIPGPPLPHPAWPCPLWAAVEALGWGIPALQGGRAHATACCSINFSPRSAEPVATRGRACMRGQWVSFFPGQPWARVLRAQQPGTLTSACFWQPSGPGGGHTSPSGAGGQAASRAGVVWWLAVGLGLFARRVRVSFCTETFSVDEMRSCRASLGGTD